MRILAPFIDQAGRRRTLYRYYHVAPKPKKVPLTRGQSIAKQIGWYLCKVVFWTTLVLAFIWGAVAAFL